MLRHVFGISFLLAAGLASPLAEQGLNLSTILGNETHSQSLDIRAPAELPMTLNVPTFHNVDDQDLYRAMVCLARNACHERDNRFQNQIRCVVNERAVAYVCEYTSYNNCALREFQLLWYHLQKATGGSKTGYLFIKDWEKTVGFDVWVGSEGRPGYYGWSTSRMCDNVPILSKDWNYDLRVNETDIWDVGEGAGKRMDEGKLPVMIPPDMPGGEVELDSDHLST
ncbi:hypothetical protein GQ53DRAFT_824488 [Thozetella sp. PMI_491]|nr:hypothetical protein GQ53DRAFT_824488 [Thozetella sp. PMI_491]